MVVYDRALTSTERENVEAYLATRYDIPDSITGVATALESGLTNVVSVTTLHRGTVAVEDMVPVDVFHWHAQSSGNSAVSPSDPGAGNRATVIDGDVALNTGLINPGDSGTLTVAQQATLGPNNSSINGLGETFERAARAEERPGNRSDRR